MSLLSVVQRASVLVNLPRPQAVTSGHGDQMAELARVEAESLANRHDWSGIVSATQFTTVAAQAQPAALPADFARFTFAGGIYGDWGRMSGPVQKAEWSRMTAYPQVQSALNGSFRIFSGGLQIYPAPPAGRVYRFDYVTKNLYLDGATPKATWAQTDTCRIPENLITLGVVWRWQKAKGLDYAESMRDAELEFEKLAGNDAAGRDIIRIGPARWGAEALAYPGVLGPVP